MKSCNFNILEAILCFSCTSILIDVGIKRYLALTLI